MKIAIVGNGECALTNKNGKFIDSCDYVVRIKNFKTTGFEEYVGTKINIFSSKWFSWFRRDSYEPIDFDFLNNIRFFLFMFFDPNQSFDLTRYKIGSYVYEYNELQLRNEYPNRMGSRIVHNNELMIRGIDYSKTLYMTPHEIFELSNLLIKSNDFYRTDVPFKSIIEPTVGIRTIYKILKLFPDEEIYITGFDGFETSWYWEPEHKVNRSHFYLNERIYLKYLVNNKMVINLDG